MGKIKQLLNYAYALILPSLYFKEDISSKVLLLNVCLFLLFLFFNKEENRAEKPKIKSIVTSYNFISLSLLLGLVLIHAFFDGAWNNAEIRFLFAALGLYLLCYMFSYYELFNFKILVLVNAVFSVLMGAYIMLLKFQGNDVVLIFQGHVFNSMLMAGNILLSCFCLLKINDKSQGVKVILLLSIVVSFITILSIGGRMSFFALVVCLLMYFFIFMGPKKSLYLFLSLCFAVGLLLFFNDTIYLRIQGFFKWNGYNPLFLRVIQWGCYVDTFVENPIFGAGHINTLESVNACYKEVAYADGVNNHYHSHNQFIEIGTKYGIIGFFTFIVFFISNIVNSYKRKDYSFMVIIIFLFLINITENVFLSRHVGNIFFTFALFNMYFRKNLMNE